MPAGSRQEEKRKRCEVAVEIAIEVAVADAVGVAVTISLLLEYFGMPEAIEYLVDRP